MQGAAAGCWGSGRAGDALRLAEDALLLPPARLAAMRVPSLPAQPRGVMACLPVGPSLSRGLPAVCRRDLVAAGASEAGMRAFFEEGSCLLDVEDSGSRATFRRASTRLLSPQHLPAVIPQGNCLLRRSGVLGGCGPRHAQCPSMPPTQPAS